MVLIVAPLKFF